MVQNPFIFSEGKEELVGREEVLEELFGKVMKQEAPLIFFIGRIGSGRTFFIKKLKQKIESETDKEIEALTLTSRAIKDLEEVPEKSEKGLVYVLDMFERMRDLDRDMQSKVIDSVDRKNEAGIGFILLITPPTLDFLENEYRAFFEKAKKVKLRSLTFKEARDLIKLRLDRIDENFPEIFSKRELRKIWREGKGNPRTILLTCASLFEKKVNEA